MTSKEALKEIKQAPTFMGGNPRYMYSTQSSEPFLEDIKVIEKDLEILEQYKKIEEELGIDLITLFKFFKKEMVFKIGDDRYNVFHTYPSYTDISLARTHYGWALKLNGFTTYDYYYLKDFNKTFRFSTKTAIGKYWALKNGGKEF